MKGGVTVEKEKTDADKILYALAYPIWIVALILVLTKKEDEDALYHGWNGLGLAIAVIAIYIGITILGFIPLVNVVAGIIGALLGPVVLVYSIVLAVQVYNNNEKPVIPIVTEFVQQYVKS